MFDDAAGEKVAHLNGVDRLALLLAEDVRREDFVRLIFKHDIFSFFDFAVFKHSGVILLAERKKSSPVIKSHGQGYRGSEHSGQDYREGRILPRRFRRLPRRYRSVDA